ncbi:hypothetical protein COL60_26985 [Bacillus pseudomycoides]|uniref:hypothetical protein n=1 Tax=Bacillus pseudomycoides TaxID=64104 RepID=UPI000BF64A4F|nr:hypothetical protein [Bacillus pseudomycoides]PFZ02727.1 hypothetical protein COL60_26985 [Bacillus pseudomycoides]
MLIKNFLLSKAKSELSPRLNHLSKKPGSINKAIKKVIKEIDNIVLEHEGFTTKEFLDSNRRYQALETVLSFLVQEGYSQVRQDYISKKSGISKPLINEMIAWLEEIGVCQQIKTRRSGKKAPSIYILAIHSNYMDIISYFRNKWALAIEVTATFSKLFQEKIFKKEQTEESKEEKPEKRSQGICHFDLNTNPETSEILEEYTSSDQKQAYEYAKIRFKNHSHVSDEDCYKIAIKMPKSMDKTQFDAFCETLECLNVQASSIDHIAAWVENAYKLIYKDHLHKQKRQQKKQVKQNKFNLIGNFDIFTKALGITLK